MCLVLVGKLTEHLTSDARVVGSNPVEIPRELLNKRNEMLVGNFLKSPKEVPRSCLVSVNTSY